MIDRNFLWFTAIVIGIVLLIVGVTRELAKPIDWELMRVQECEVKLGGTVHERPCNEMFYEISEIRD